MSGTGHVCCSFLTVFVALHGARSSIRLKITQFGIENRSGYCPGRNDVKTDEKVRLFRKNNRKQHLRLVFDFDGKTVFIEHWSCVLAWRHIGLSYLILTVSYFIFIKPHRLHLCMFLFVYIIWGTLVNEPYVEQHLWLPFREKRYVDFCVFLCLKSHMPAAIWAEYFDNRRITTARACPIFLHMFDMSTPILE